MNSPSSNPAATRRFLDLAFADAATSGLLIGTSAFPPKGGMHAWHGEAAAAADWCAQRGDVNVYFRTTLVAQQPSKGRGAAADAAAMIGVHADIDIADPVHKKRDLAPDIETAQRVIAEIGLRPTLVIFTGHGIQAHWLFDSMWQFQNDDDRERGQAMAKAFGAHVQRCARRVGVSVDTVSDLARLMRVPGTLNIKSDPVAVTIVDESGPRHSVEGVLDVCRDPGSTDIPSSRRGLAAVDPTPSASLPPDSEVIARASEGRRGRDFRALFERGDLMSVDGDASRGDWHLCRLLADACEGDAARVDRLFRRSALMRPKWHERHAGDGRTYGAMTIADVLESRRQRTTATNSDGAQLPVIVVSGRQLREMSKDVVEAIRAAQVAPTIFEWGGGLAQIVPDRGRGQHGIEPLSVDSLVGIMSRAADFVRVGKGGDPVACYPPPGVARDVLTSLRGVFPVLRGLVTCPRMRPDGTVLSSPGYDPATGLYLAPYEGWETFEVPTTPTEFDVAAARSMLNDLLVDFPFVGGTDRANALAFMLTPIVRPAIAGCVPMAAFDALSKQGTGKGLLAKTLMSVATGRLPAMVPLASDESERRKAIFAALVQGADVVLFDNAEVDAVESAVLANALTAEVFEDRVLGATRRIAAPVRCTWGITGNALTFGRDMLRRVYIITLDAGVEQPELRSGFKHDLPRHALKHHTAYLRAALILCRYWWAQGCPAPSGAPMGSFEDWVFKVGGILECAGIEGFLANREQLRETSDDERAEWRAFIEAAVSALPTGRPFTVNTLADAVDTTSSLMDSLPSPLREAWDAKHNFSVRLGQALKKRSGAVFGALRLCRAGREPHSRRPLYRIDAAGSSPTRIRGGGVAGVCGGLASDSRDASDELDWEPEVISTRRALREPPQTPADPCTPPVE